MVVRAARKGSLTACKANAGCGGEAGEFVATVHRDGSGGGGRQNSACARRDANVDTHDHTYSTAREGAVVVVVVVGFCCCCCCCWGVVPAARAW